MPETHEHTLFEVPEDFADPLGRTGIDYPAMGRLMSAAFDGCTTCQEAMLSPMAEDAKTTARVIEFVCGMIAGIFGGLPVNLHRDHPGALASPQFRTLARAGMDGHSERMFAACAEMDPNDRRAALNTALDLFVGYSAVGLG